MSRLHVDQSKKIALSLSGGGYRATLFALGALKALNNMGLLSQLGTITSVSGGSIASGFLGAHWKDLKFVDGVATNFDKVIIEPLNEFCSEDLDVGAALSGIFSFSDTIGDKIAKKYDIRLFKGLRLKDIPDNDKTPLFIFYGTNYHTGSSIRFSQRYISDWRIGQNLVDNPSLAKVIGISSAFPPFLAPVTLKTDPKNWQETKHATHFSDSNLKSELLLCDGGLYDNLGLEAITKQDKDGFEYGYVICCDAGAPFEITSSIKTNWMSQFMRMTDIMINQQRALRKRNLLTYLTSKELKGTYFSISNQISQYAHVQGLPDLKEVLMIDTDKTKALAQVPTRLTSFDRESRILLINWGEALCDAAIRRWCPDLVSASPSIVAIDSTNE